MSTKSLKYDLPSKSYVSTIVLSEAVMTCANVAPGYLIGGLDEGLSQEPLFVDYLAARRSDNASSITTIQQE